MPCACERRAGSIDVIVLLQYHPACLAGRLVAQEAGWSYCCMLVVTSMTERDAADALHSCAVHGCVAHAAVECRSKHSEGFRASWHIDCSIRTVESHVVRIVLAFDSFVHVHHMQFM